ncbi:MULTISPECIES: histidine kinase [unclassified Crossiella]|uniref:histidine kinase n=1 Tax=unclassified Crossiella TaxID=2620835 RepID=UPI001FFE4E66|nr:MULTISPECIES: histidine kinase [unclassified Crossiella]MCK2243193.1 histidine kinase [Crossiella sp. S99.2]MCK2254338.1 histidine kinase [Crossiella sp. S99.1]
MTRTSALFVLLLLLTALSVALLVIVRRSRANRDFGTPTDRATFETLHAASLAAPPLRAGLTAEAARKAIRRLRDLLGTPALCLTDQETVLAWSGDCETHAASALTQAAETLRSGRVQVSSARCADSRCPLRHAVIAPLVVDEHVLGTLIAYSDSSPPILVRATKEVANWVSAQLELAELDRSRTRLVEAEMQALRAQISPHFIYNSLATIAAFVRTDPERARELLLDFADFTRHSFRKHGEFTTLADELRAIHQYLTLAIARSGDKLAVTFQVAPEVLPVAVPFLCLQPLVENAVQHGLSGRDMSGRVTILARDAGAEAEIVIEDDGAGMDPETLRGILAGAGAPSEGIGMANVDERLRQVYGDDYGLVVETALGAGTKVRVRVPKYRAGVHVTPPAVHTPY